MAAAAAGDHKSLNDKKAFEGLEALNDKKPLSDDKKHLNDDKKHLSDDHKALNDDKKHLNDKKALADRDEKKALEDRGKHPLCAKYGDKHTMCLGVPGSKCTNAKTTIGLTKDEQKQIVDMHNEKRRLVNQPWIRIILLHHSYKKIFAIMISLPLEKSPS